jgi:diadenosine tetraphosphate (Ap4A) HIT family hydrolase
MELTDYRGETVQVDCLACARERGEVAIGDIVRTEYFDAHQDFSIPIPGFVILSARRHVRSVDEFTDAELVDFARLLKRTRSAMRASLGLESVHIFQEEDTRHRHFHLWIVPRYPWMEEMFGGRIESIRPSIEYAKERMRTPEHLGEVDRAVDALRIALIENTIPDDGR